MTNKQFWFWALAMVIPSAYQRTKFWLFPQSFQKLNLIRRWTGHNIHHGHWGLVIAFICYMIERFHGQNAYITVISGIGWGLLLDEIIPALKPPGHTRDEELAIYRDSTKQSLALVWVIVIVSGVLQFTCRH